jgi:hypothetical protein
MLQSPITVYVCAAAALFRLRKAALSVIISILVFLVCALFCKEVTFGYVVAVLLLLRLNL